VKSENHLRRDLQRFTSPVHFTFETRTGGRQRVANPANDERNRRFYQKLKQSTTDVEAAVPQNQAEITTQLQTFQQAIIGHNRRTIHEYCLFGRNLRALKARDHLTDVRQQLNYSLLNTFQQTKTTGDDQYRVHM